VAELEAIYQARNRPERPHSRLAQARRKLGVRERRLERRRGELERACKWLECRQVKAAIVQAGLCELERRLEQFIKDNHSNPAPVRAIFRLDGGFGSGANVALLVEMGYEVYTKAKNHQVSFELCAGEYLLQPLGRAWERMRRWSVGRAKASPTVPIP